MPQVEVNLSAHGAQVGQPWIWRLSREFEVKVNIVKASVDTGSGWMRIVLDGPVEEIQRATAWLMSTGMHVEALERSLGA
jgi:ABC-type methionine transport system ATPase subunit